MDGLEVHPDMGAAVRMCELDVIHDVYVLKICPLEKDGRQCGIRPRAVGGQELTVKQADRSDSLYVYLHGFPFFVPMISEQPEGPSWRIRKRTFLKILSPGRKIFGKAGFPGPGFRSLRDGDNFAQGIGGHKREAARSITLLPIDRL